MLFLIQCYQLLGSLELARDAGDPESTPGIALRHPFSHTPVVDNDPHLGLAQLRNLSGRTAHGVGLSDAAVTFV